MQSIVKCTGMPTLDVFGYAPSQNTNIVFVSASPYLTQGFHGPEQEIRTGSLQSAMFGDASKVPHRFSPMPLPTWVRLSEAKR
jgi:hypothetical protein